MAKTRLGMFSFVAVILSIIFFFLPVLLGTDSVVALFIISFILLLTAFFVSMAGLNRNDNWPGLTLASMVISIIFLLFLTIGAVLQA